MKNNNEPIAKFKIALHKGNLSINDINNLTDYLEVKDKPLKIIGSFEKNNHNKNSINALFKLEQNDTLKQMSKIEFQSKQDTIAIRNKKFSAFESHSRKPSESFIYENNKRQPNRKSDEKKIKKTSILRINKNFINQEVNLYAKKTEIQIRKNKSREINLAYRKVKPNKNVLEKIKNNLKNNILNTNKNSGNNIIKNYTNSKRNINKLSIAPKATNKSNKDTDNSKSRSNFSKTSLNFLIKDFIEPAQKCYYRSNMALASDCKDNYNFDISEEEFSCIENEMKSKEKSIIAISLSNKKSKFKSNEKLKSFSNKYHAKNSEANISIAKIGNSNSHKILNSLSFRDKSSENFVNKSYFEQYKLNRKKNKNLSNGSFSKNLSQIKIKPNPFSSENFNLKNNKKISNSLTLISEANMNNKYIFYDKQYIGNKLNQHKQQGKNEIQEYYHIPMAAHKIKDNIFHNKAKTNFSYTRNKETNKDDFINNHSINNPIQEKNDENKNLNKLKFQFKLHLEKNSKIKNNTDVNEYDKNNTTDEQKINNINNKVNYIDNPNKKMIKTKKDSIEIPCASKKCIVESNKGSQNSSLENYKITNAKNNIDDVNIISNPIFSGTRQIETFNQIKNLNFKKNKKYSFGLNNSTDADFLKGQINKNCIFNYYQNNKNYTNINSKSDVNIKISMLTKNKSLFINNTGSTVNNSISTYNLNNSLKLNITNNNSNSKKKITPNMKKSIKADYLSRLVNQESIPNGYTNIKNNISQNLTKIEKSDKISFGEFVIKQTQNLNNCKNEKLSFDERKFKDVNKITCSYTHSKNKINSKNVSQEIFYNKSFSNCQEIEDNKLNKKKVSTSGCNNNKITNVNNTRFNKTLKYFNNEKFNNICNAIINKNLDDNHSYSSLAKKLKRTMENKKSLELYSNVNFQIINNDNIDNRNISNTKIEENLDNKMNNEEENILRNIKKHPNTKYKISDIPKSIPPARLNNNVNSIEYDIIINKNFNYLNSESNHNSKVNKSSNSNLLIENLTNNNNYNNYNNYYINLSNKELMQKDNLNMNTEKQDNKLLKNIFSKSNPLLNFNEKFNLNTRKTDDSLKFSYYLNKNFSQLEINGPEELHFFYLNLSQQNKKLFYTFDKIEANSFRKKYDSNTVYLLDNHIDI